MGLVFRALADESRRALLDRLFERDGQPLGELAAGMEMTRFGVMKHLDVLEQAGLITTRRAGREKFHYLNPVPIRLIHDRWISKFAEPWVGAMADLKHALEAEPVETPSHVYEIYIRTTPERVWAGLTDGALTRRYFHDTAIESDWRPGSPVVYRFAEGDRAGLPAVEGTVLECDPPRRLAFTWHVLYDQDQARERPSRVAFEITGLGESCRLRVVHDDFDADSLVYPSISQGWAPLLSSLKSLLETGEPLLVDA